MLIFNFNKFYKKCLFIFSKIIPNLNLKLWVTFICLAFIGNSIYGNFEDLANQEITLREILWLLLGVGFSLLSIMLNAYAWKLLINSIGCNSNKVNIFKIFLNTNIYKYLPGGIWHFVSRYNILKLNFSKEKSIESIVLEPLLMMVAGLIFVPFGSSNIALFIICWSSTLLFLTTFREFIIKKLISMKTSVFNKKSNYSFYKNKNQDISTKVFFPYYSLFVEIIFVLFRFLGFLCCINAFFIATSYSFFELISYFSLAWTIGLVVPAAPGGLGVFEAAILFSLGTKIPEANLLASLLCYRMVSTLSDIFAALIYPAKRLFKI